MKIRMYDLAAHNGGELRPLFHKALDNVLDAAYFHGGEPLVAFEEAFATLCGTEFAIGVCSGTVALFLALRACGIQHGDEVITAPNSDIATTAAISYSGATPTWVDIDSATFNIDPAKLAGQISHKTKAVVPVHLYGLPAEMDAINAVAEEFELIVIEDAALATAAEYYGQPIGGLGKAGCFSFAETKILGALGAGGMITTNDPVLAEHLYRIRSYGESRSTTSLDGSPIRPHAEGLNVGLGALQAAFLHSKLPFLERWVQRRQEIANMYRELLQGSRIALPTVPDHCRHVYRTFVVRVENRDAVRDFMREKGVETGLHYIPPLHLQPIYKHLGCRRGSFPVAEQLADELLCLPIYPEMSNDQVEGVAMTLLQADERCR